MDNGYTHFSNDFQLQSATEDAYHALLIEGHDQYHESHRLNIQTLLSSTPTSTIADYSHSSLDPGLYNRLPHSAGPTFERYASPPISPAIPAPSYRRPLSFPGTFPRSTVHVDDFNDPISPLPFTASEEQKIAWTKKRNTRSAKLSRIRKARHMKELEEEHEELKQEMERWRSRAETLRQLLVSHGIPYPPFKS
ncbi:hypothetical protein J3R30DRAFT_1129732 [Lentinula aciculospora]|uniref:BZIP domain-containing protein n=1 Tax=Lentinula aciculospora TaxID=153920 RepID=A0A9W9A103_9AGAR|nr:hypothetical protein J3R30DRAFT_1129732 [Lentinula aciculospora]